MKIELDFVGQFVLDHTFCKSLNFTITNKIEIFSKSNHSISEIDLISKSILTNKCKVFF